MYHETKGRSPSRFNFKDICQQPLKANECERYVSVRGIQAFAALLFILLIMLPACAEAITFETVKQELDLPKVDYLIDARAVYTQAQAHNLDTFASWSSNLMKQDEKRKDGGGGHYSSVWRKTFSPSNTLVSDQDASWVEYQFSDAVIGADGTRFDLYVREDNLKGISTTQDSTGMKSWGPSLSLGGFAKTDADHPNKLMWSPGNNSMSAARITYQIRMPKTQTPAPEGLFLLAFYDIDQEGYPSLTQPGYDWNESVAYNETSAIDGKAYVLPDHKLEIQGDRVLGNEALRASRGSSTESWKEAGVITVARSQGASVELQGYGYIGIFLLSEPIQFRVDARVEGIGGSVSNPNQPLLPRWDYTTKIIAEEGYAIDTITLDGASYNLSHLTVEEKDQGAITRAEMSLSDVRANHSIIVTFKRVFGGLTVYKRDAQTNEVPQGKATFEGAEFGLYPTKGSPETVEPIATATTDASGVAHFDKVFMGTYVLREIRAPKGYTLSGTSQEIVVSPGENNEFTWNNDIETVQFTLTKRDQYSDDVPSGSGSLTAVGSIYLAQGQHPIAIGDRIIQPDEAVLENIALTKEGTTLDPLPYAEYLFRETEAGAGYLLRSDDSVLNPDENTSPIIVANTPMRFHLAFRKVDAETKKPLAGVAFKIASQTTGESHIVYTDRAGVVDTTRQEESTNAWDDVISEASESGLLPIPESPHDELTLSSIWFGNSDTEHQEGALLFDTYTISELPTITNEGYELIEHTFDTTSAQAGQTIDLGDIENKRLEEPLPDDPILPEEHEDVPSNPDKGLYSKTGDMARFFLPFAAFVGVVGMILCGVGVRKFAHARKVRAKQLWFTSHTS